MRARVPRLWVGPFKGLSIEIIAVLPSLPFDKSKIFRMPCYLSVRKPNVRERVKVSRKYGKRSLKNIIVLRYTVSAPFSAIPPPPLPLPSTFLPVLFHVCERIDKGKTSKVNQNTKALLAGDNFACIPFSNFSHPYR